MTLKRLVEILAQEQRIHERILKAKRDERKLLAAGDADKLLKNTERISDLTEQAKEWEERRIEASNRIAEEWGVWKDGLTLKDLLEALPPANRAELEQARQSLKTTLEAVRSANRSNRLILQRSVSAIREQLKQRTPHQESGVYTSKGVLAQSEARRAGLNIRV
ncbi:MAG: flagellar protein FlgN [Candidatus Omnitrophica bacterium]|nr:flagellar protein FlgN [Candidatus Omnitrophota bacterium]